MIYNLLSDYSQRKIFFTLSCLGATDEKISEQLVQALRNSSRAATNNFEGVTFAFIHVFRFFSKEDFSPVSKELLVFFKYLYPNINIALSHKNDDLIPILTQIMQKNRAKLLALSSLNASATPHERLLCLITGSKTPDKRFNHISENARILVAIHICNLEENVSSIDEEILQNLLQLDDVHSRVTELTILSRQLQLGTNINPYIQAYTSRLFPGIISGIIYRDKLKLSKFSEVFQLVEPHITIENLQDFNWHIINHGLNHIINIAALIATCNEAYRACLCRNFVHFVIESDSSYLQILTRYNYKETARTLELLENKKCTTSIPTLLPMLLECTEECQKDFLDQLILMGINTVPTKTLRLLKFCLEEYGYSVALTAVKHFNKVKKSSNWNIKHLFLKALIYTRHEFWGETESEVLRHYVFLMRPVSSRAEQYFNTLTEGERSEYFTILFHADHEARLDNIFVLKILKLLSVEDPHFERKATLSSLFYSKIESRENYTDLYPLLDKICRNPNPNLIPIAVALNKLPTIEHQIKACQEIIKMPKEIMQLFFCKFQNPSMFIRPI